MKKSTIILALFLKGLVLLGPSFGERAHALSPGDRDPIGANIIDPNVVIPSTSGAEMNVIFDIGDTAGLSQFEIAQRMIDARRAARAAAAPAAAAPAAVVQEEPAGEEPPVTVQDLPQDPPQGQGLQGPPGPQGERGERGPQGIPGPGCTCTGGRCQCDFTARFGAIDETLDEHDETLDEHGETLDEHGEAIGEFRTEFDDVWRVLNLQGQGMIGLSNDVSDLQDDVKSLQADFDQFAADVGKTVKLSVVAIVATAITTGVLTYSAATGKFKSLGDWFKGKFKKKPTAGLDEERLYRR